MFWVIEGSGKIAGEKGERGERKGRGHLKGGKKGQF